MADFGLRTGANPSFCVHCGINMAVNGRSGRGETMLGITLWIPFGERGRVGFGSQGGARSSLTLGYFLEPLTGFSVAAEWLMRRLGLLS